MKENSRTNGEGKAPVGTHSEPAGTRSGEEGSPGFHLNRVLRRLTAALGRWRGEEAVESRVEIGGLSTLCRKALDLQGEIAGLVAIARVADAFKAMTAEEKALFFVMLARDFPADSAGVERAIADYQKGEGARVAQTQGLKEALESPRLRLLRLFNTIQSGMKFLVDMRADLLPPLRQNPELAGVEYDLHHILESWFNLGFLELQRISWETPAEILEKLIRYEAVHEITGWGDLKHRLISDRGCFAFFHPAIPNEPIIMLEVALVNGMADNVQSLLDIKAPHLLPSQADTAIFYSISNTQKGLRGVPLGNFLIKQVVARLRADYPNLTTFATLSPIPGFRRDVLEPALEPGPGRDGLGRFFNNGEARRLCELTGGKDAGSAAAQALGREGWPAEKELAAALRPGLLRAAGAYLTGGESGEGTPCPVAHFHASNGALLARINWMANISPEGMRRSAGIMVNYLYDLKQLENVQTTYLKKRQLTVASEVRKL